MNTRFFFPAAAAALAAGTGLLAFSRPAAAQQERPPAAGQAQKFRFEFKNDGSAPRFWHNGQEGDGSGQGIQDSPMGEWLRRMLEGAGGAGTEGMEELFKQFAMLIKALSFQEL